MPTRRLTVLQVLPALESGGVEKGTLEVAAALVGKGHRSMVMSAGGRMVERLLDVGSEHYQWPIGKKSLSTLWLIRKLRKFFIEQQIDIVHVRSRLPAWIVYLAWKRMDPTSRPRFMTTVHGFNSVSWYSEIMLRGEKVIAVSNSVKQYVMDHYPQTEAGRITVIHRGIDREQYPYGFQPHESWVSDWYQQFPSLVERKVVTLPGRITRLKGHEDFVRIIKILVTKGFPVSGIIAGGAEEKKREYFQELQALITNEG
ncbi:MAG: glycosyltransferase, partial [Gammaproteobacteria bacterium]|nr:glycosyltransferase [Gammaproteobacteria bacterium]